MKPPVLRLRREPASCITPPGLSAALRPVQGLDCSSPQRCKHLVVNAKETGWFVWNMCSFALKDAMNITAMEWPNGTDDFAKAGLDQAPATACAATPTMPIPGASGLAAAGLEGTA